jgi:hypothetical protein
LVKADQLELVEGLPVPGFLHTDHRWMLPILRWAQIAGKLPTPTGLVTFDRHHDALPPRNPTAVACLADRPPSVADLTQLCVSGLSTLDDDWITTGMELGIISDAAVFGVDDRGPDILQEFVDSNGVSHRVFFCALPTDALDHQGELSDVARQHALAPFWSFLSWRPKPKPGSGFEPARTLFALDFDLDCFVIPWWDYHLVWTDEVWEGEFLECSTQWSTSGYTGVAWLDELASRAGLVTFATEPNCCGGVPKSNKVWQDLNRYLFDNRLTRRPFP